MFLASATINPIVCSAAETTRSTRARSRRRCRAPRGRVDVDVVDAHTGPPDHLETRGAVDQVARESRRGADHDPVVAVDHVLERGVWIDVDLEALSQERDTRLCDRLPDEDAHFG